MYLREIKHLSTQKCVRECFSSMIHNSQKVEITQMSWPDECRHHMWLLLQWNIIISRVYLCWGNWECNWWGYDFYHLFYVTQYGLNISQWQSFICYLYNKQTVSKQQQRIKPSKEWEVILEEGEGVDWRESKRWLIINAVNLKVLENNNKQGLKIANEILLWSLQYTVLKSRLTVAHPVNTDGLWF